MRIEKLCQRLSRRHRPFNAAPAPVPKAPQRWGKAVYALRFAFLKLPPLVSAASATVSGMALKPAKSNAGSLRAINYRSIAALSEMDISSSFVLRSTAIHINRR
jgi:hypothetical protein